MLVRPFRGLPRLPPTPTLRTLLPSLCRRPNMALYNMSSSSSSPQAIHKIDTHHQYKSSGLSESDLLPDPIELFSRWFAHARSPSSGVPEAEAVCLSTSTPDGKVSSRFVLLKRVDSRGFVIFSNYESRKGQELASNPRAALAFYWRELHQQVRVTGRTEKVSKEETEEYFKTRPIGSQIGAWASPQSRPVSSREALEKLVTDTEDRFHVERGSGERDQPSEADKRASVDTPDHWGGIRIVPDEIEFWKGRTNRLHDRFVYTRDGDAGEWHVQRLGP